MSGDMTHMHVATQLYPQTCAATPPVILAPGGTRHGRRAGGEPKARPELRVR